MHHDYLDHKVRINYIWTKPVFPFCFCFSIMWHDNFSFIHTKWHSSETFTCAGKKDCIFLNWIWNLKISILFWGRAVEKWKPSSSNKNKTHFSRDNDLDGLGEWLPRKMRCVGREKKSSQPIILFQHFWVGTSQVVNYLKQVPSGALNRISAFPPAIGSS